MRIAQIAPLAESVPPKLYGGTERVVHWLTEELVALGHEVTLFASGDSKTSANLVPVIPHALRLGRPRMDPVAAQALLLEAVVSRFTSLTSSTSTSNTLDDAVIALAGRGFLFWRELAAEGSNQIVPGRRCLLGCTLGSGIVPPLHRLQHRLRLFARLVGREGRVVANY